MPELFQHFRYVEAGEMRAYGEGGYGSLDMDIEIRHETDSTEFMVAFYNLADETWKGIKEGDGCVVRLGWRPDGPIERVLLGVIEDRYIEHDGADTKYVIEGREETNTQLDMRLSYTWKGASIDEIVADLARFTGLVPGEIESVPKPYPGNKAITDEKSVKGWLEHFVEEAKERTNDGWTIHAESGKLDFFRTNTKTARATPLSYDTILLEIEEETTSGRGEEGGETVYTFKALCEPRFNQFDVVSVDTDKISGIFEISELEYTSSSTSGDHFVEGVLKDANETYEPVYPGKSDS